MYYYILDVYHKTIFKSETNYSNEEFLEIIKKAYKSSCESICREYDFIDRRCDFLIGITVLWNDKFNEIIEEISDLEIIRPSEHVHVGLSITPNENNRTILRCLQSLDLGDCKTNCDVDKINKKYHCAYGDNWNDGGFCSDSWDYIPCFTVGDISVK